MSKVKFVQVSVSVYMGGIIVALDENGRVWKHDITQEKWILIESPEEGL